MAKRKSYDKPTIYEYDKELAAGFKADCEEFLEEFEKLNSCEFSDFALIWQLRHFSFVYADQNYALLLREFCENCFYIVKKYIMFPRSLYTQVGAFYMLYGLYYEQPLKRWVKIRLTFDEYNKIKELIEEMKNRRQLDAVYIFAKMKTEGAFLYVALLKPLGPEDRFVKGFEFYYDDTFSCSKMNTSIGKYNSIGSSELVQELEKTDNEYQDLFRKYSEKCTSLVPFSSTIVKDLRNACMKFKRDGTSSQENNEEIDIKNPMKASRESLRMKAMTNKNAVYRGSRKVKTAVDEDMLNNTTDQSDSD